jgi:hypothetical protein
VRPQPQHPGSALGVYSTLVPPGRFVTAAMHFAMMAAAERNGELVADLAAKSG